MGHRTRLGMKPVTKFRTRKTWLGLLSSFWILFVNPGMHVQAFQERVQPDSLQQSSLKTRAQTALSVVSGTLKVEGLQRPVNVLRDRWGVAHIYAGNQHDLFFAQGFVAAQDRLFQMELWKRSGQGRLAEVLGKFAIDRDRFARLLKYRGDVRREYKSYATDTLSILSAFTDGINAYIRS